MDHFFESTKNSDRSSTDVSVHEVLAGHEFRVMGRPEQYVNLSKVLDSQDPFALDIGALRELFQQTNDDVTCGFLLGLMEVHCNLSNFATIPGMYCPDPEGLEFVGNRLIEGFSPGFMEEMNYVNPMSASPEELLTLASCADDEFSRGYCIAIMSIRAQLGMIHPQFGDGLAINVAMQSISWMTPMQSAQNGRSTHVI